MTMTAHEPPVDFSAPAPAPDVMNGAPTKAHSPEPAEEARAKVAEQIVQLVESRTEMFHDEKGTAYAAVQTGARREVLRLNSRQMRSWVARTMRTEIRKTIGKNAIDEAITTLEGIARFDCEMRPLQLRIAAHDGAIYVDLGDESGDCVRASAEGWEVIAASPVMFRRTDSMRPLPRPTRGGGLDELRPFVNLPDDDAHLLFVAWLVAALRPGKPFPILALHGEQGTAKSTATRVVRALVDPNLAPIRSAPRKEDDLTIAAIHSHVVAFDNLSGAQPWLSDALCRLATGGGLSKRTLFTDDDETVLDAIRPIGQRHRRHREPSRPR